MKPSDDKITKNIPRHATSTATPHSLDVSKHGSHSPVTGHQTPQGNEQQPGCSHEHGMRQQDADLVRVRGRCVGPVGTGRGAGRSGRCARSACRCAHAGSVSARDFISGGLGGGG